MADPQNQFFDRGGKANFISKSEVQLIIVSFIICIMQV